MFRLIQEWYLKEHFITKIHSVSFKINDDDVTVMDTNGTKSKTTHISIDSAIDKQRDLLKWGYL